MSKGTDVAIILGLPTDGFPVTGMTMSSFEVLEAECLHQFGVAPRTGVHWKFLPLLREFGSIIQYSWRSACLAHLYRALCRASRVDYRVDPNIIPAEIYMHSVVWSATVPLVSFECIEWHATDRYRRQFRFVQGVPHEDRNLDKAHGEVLTGGPKNINWATAPTHYSWHPLDTYMHWYRGKFGNRLNLSNLVGEENDEGNQDLDEGQYVPQTHFNPSFPQHQQYWGMSQFEPCEGGSFSQLLGFMAGDVGQSQFSHQTEFMSGRYSLDARYPGHTSSVASGGFVSVDSSRSDGGCGVLNSQNPHPVSMGLIEENANTLDQETDAYLVDNPDDEDDDEKDEIEEFDEDEESCNDGQARTPDDKAKDYNLRIDPPRRSANRYTPSVFKKAAKKCKEFVKDVKWSMRK
ncbi:Serine/threonine protein phosphatase 7 long form isogeny [Arachis hypogaea]|nr:Serine/threonine protein phosphatase 7 long form isogeny [Arachis hypogaea]